MYRPLIGITPGYDYEKSTSYIKDGYYEGINRAGGAAVILPAIVDDDVLSEYINTCRGFLISGGPDVDARHYGEPNLEFNGDISPYRDYMEIYVIKKAIELGKPVFGICRGVQMMNIASGGTLYQDIKAQMEDRDVIKHSQAAPRWYPTHDIYVEKGSRVWKSFGGDRASVNSFHHQAVKDVAPGYKVTSRASDGIIESIEHTSHIFAVGVQWHPELMWQKNEVFLRLFEDFVECCRNAG